MSKGIEQLNKSFKAEFERYGSLESFTKYVMSETIAPIEDYPSVVNLIRSNYHKQISVDLLMIGAYLAIQWTNHYNELLGILNFMEPCLPDREKAIVHYLNAYKLHIRDENYPSDPERQTELRTSLTFNIPFVNNRCLIAEYSTKEDAKKYYREALDNVQKVFSEEDIMKLPLEHFLEPQSFINEFILGTHISYINYEGIKKKL